MICNTRTKIFEFSLKDSKQQRFYNIGSSFLYGFHHLTNQNSLCVYKYDVTTRKRSLALFASLEDFAKTELYEPSQLWHPTVVCCSGMEVDKKTGMIFAQDNYTELIVLDSEFRMVKKFNTTLRELEYISDIMISPAHVILTMCSKGQFGFEFLKTAGEGKDLELVLDFKISHQRTDDDVIWNSIVTPDAIVVSFSNPNRLGFFGSKGEHLCSLHLDFEPAQISMTGIDRRSILVASWNNPERRLVELFLRFPKAVALLGGATEKHGKNSLLRKCRMRSRIFDPNALKETLRLSGAWLQLFAK